MTGLVNRNVVAGGRRTSMRHPEPTWSVLDAIREREKLSMPALVALAEAAHPGLVRSVAVRTYALLYWRDAALAAERSAGIPGHPRRVAPPIHVTPEGIAP